MLDPTTVQVHVADLQDSIVELSATNPAAVIRRSAAGLARLARFLDIPITLSAVPRPGGPGIIEELTAVVPDAPVFVRSGPSCWDDEPLRRAVIGHDRPELVVCGVLSEAVVLHSTVDALAAGFRVQVVVDACGGLSARTERAAFDQILAAGGRITSVASLVSDIVRDFTTASGRQVIGALHEMLAP